MIKCSQCGYEIIRYPSGEFGCSSCRERIQSKEGTLLFHSEQDRQFSDYDVSGLDKLFKAEQKHFWFQRRKQVILDAFHKYVPKQAKIIEIGAGTGDISRMLLEDGYNVAVGEVHSLGLMYAKGYGIQDRYQFNLLQSPFYEHFDVVGMFDVLEHIEDDKLALNKVFEALKPNGLVLVTVPAHKALWNREDAIAHHKKRYEKEELESLFTSLPFEIMEARYFFVSILPLLYLRTILQRDHGGPISAEEYKKEFKVIPLVNNILNSMLALESKLLRKVKSPAGGSILLIARKLANDPI